MFKHYLHRCSSLLATAAAVMLSIPAHAVDLNLSQTPLYLSPAVPPLNLLVIGRDHKLYYEAYNDYTDLNEDGTLDTKYKPTQIDYYGYFDSFKCYTHDGSKFNPSRTTSNKQCTNEWSGDFLNYLTTARIDALRKVLYGGYRTVDSSGATVLERTYIPQDAHSWGKEYTSVAVDGYDLRRYAPMTLPSSGKRHLFANTTPLNVASPLLTLNQPLLRILTNRDERIWNWVSIERPVAHTQVLNASGTKINVTPTDLIVKVAVCVPTLLESNCRSYVTGNTTTYKPIGLLQEFGENDSMYFGLVTGSYAKNTSGGVLRRGISSIANEINTNGTFRTDVVGTIATLNRMRVTGFDYPSGTSGYQYTCGFNAAARVIGEGECQMWGNPIAEMMYEGLRYFAGKGQPTDAFKIAFGAGEEQQLQQTNGGLPVASWDNPYSNRPYCSKPFETVVSDINPSYDTDQLPGSAYGSFSGDLNGMDVSDLGQQIWNGEFGAGTTKKIFIGDVNGVTDGAPTSKTVSSFGNIRGLSPEEPTKRGGYYAASVAYYGAINDISPAQGDQNVQTFSVALASPLPKIEIPVGGRKISLVPFAKSVNGSGISPTATFQPTDQIVDFYVDTLTSTYGKFRVNFEDVEQGADHDMDAITIYEYTVNANNTVTVTLTSEYAFGGITQHMGYVISGTTKDGTYLEVLDKRDGNGDPTRDPANYNDVDYRLDTPPAFTGTPPAPNTGTGRWNDGQWLPFTASRTFSAGSTEGATVLPDPLWYAAKWGGFKDSNDNNRPDVQTEWDNDAVGTRGYNSPDNYFLVTNALKLSQQLRDAFKEIIARSSSAAPVSLSSGAVTGDTRVYQAKFDTAAWTGQLLAYRVTSPPGKVDRNALWDAAAKMPLPADRHIVTINSDGVTPVAFRYGTGTNVLDATRMGQLNATTAVAQAYVDFLRGSAAQEGETKTYKLRERPTKLGDIVSSAPIYVGAPRAGYQANFEGGSGYPDFVKNKKDRAGMVYVGANDGMLHGFDSVTGVEKVAFIPSPVFGNLKALTQPGYAHQYYVDGSPNAADVYFNGGWHSVLVGGLNLGGQGIYALNVTDPTSFATAESSPSSLFMWEFTDRNDADLGFTYSQPAIVYMQDGSWAAVFGNGYNNTVPDGRVSATGNAVLYIVDIETGALIRKIDSGVGMADDPTGASRPNGMATPTLVDTDGDRVVDHAYVGDLFGNLWKVDLSSSDPNDWGFAYGTADNPQPFFVAVDGSGNRQPITVRPEVARGPNSTGIIVVFGTGKYLEDSDKQILPRRDQTFYGLLDLNNGESTDRITGRDQLVQQTVDAEIPITRKDGSKILTRRTSQRPISGKGWYLDLVAPAPTGYQGERSVSDPLVRDERVIFTTLLPNSDPCGFGGKSWFMVLDLLSGGRLTEAQTDTDGDGDVDENDESTSGTQQDGAGTEANAATCLSADCPGDLALNSDSGGNLNEMILRSYGAARGRQSWRKVR